ncbi:hypothetical protein J7K06_01325 [Candidatus Bathyarchaeota archaeon]|nr:hypothetical protein [Candidatus Bathyarchaeota archaeon]
MSTKELAEKLVKKFGEKYSEILGIKVQTNSEKEVFKWFLASILFGAPITEKSAIKTYRCFEKNGVLTPEKIIEAGWDRLVNILDEGSYTRYDFKTATKLLEVAENLQRSYNGSLKRLCEKASDPLDLEKKIKELGKGIGDTTVSIFLRELRGIWPKADPKPTSLVILAAKNLGIIKSEKIDAAKRELEDFWRQNVVEGYDFVNFETALLRVGKDYCRKRKCKVCKLNVYCKIYHR